MDLERTLRRQPIKTARCTCGQPTWAPPRVRRSRRISYSAGAARICYKFRTAIKGEGMVSRRKFLGSTGLAAAWPNAAWAQDEKAKAKPKPKPEGVVVNDVHAQLNSTRVYRIVEPQSIDAVRAAMKLARTEKRALCIAGGRHALGPQQFPPHRVPPRIRQMNKLRAFHPEPRPVQ